MMLGKYRIRRRVGEGAFASVYEAFDTIEGISVALKIPHAHLMNDEALELFRQEVRLCARLDHPNILPIKNAAFLDGMFVICSPLGQGTLADRLQRRVSLPRSLRYSEQILAALGHAHGHRVIHCDVKPENFVLFPNDRLRLTDFGIAKVARATLQATGSGTIGYMAPEQAMGRPSFRSDVFSAGLIMYRLFSGTLPTWPFDWPPPRYDRLKASLHPDLVNAVRRALSVRPEQRFADAASFLEAFQRIRPRALRPSRRRARKSRSTANWQEVRWKQFLRQNRKSQSAWAPCRKCGGPVGEAMHHCPWCASEAKRFRGTTKFPASCKRCKRGNKLDWLYCAWCYGSRRRDPAPREYSDVRYVARCPNASCPRRELMPFMRYCPWCHRKTRQAWPWPGSRDRCPGCGWGVTREFWSHCPWCRNGLKRVRR